MNNWCKVLVAAAGLVLGGCGTTYKYDNQTFKSSSEALAYQSRVLSAGISNLKPAESKIGGTLRIYFPNQDVIRAKSITGNAAGNVGDYLVAVTMADVSKLKQAFEQRQSFDAVELNYSQGEHKKAEPGVHVIYLYLESPQVLGWYYIGAAVPKSPLAFDRGTTDKTEKYRLFTESVESLAMAERVATKR
jgi:hypothetical protein